LTTAVTSAWGRLATRQHLPLALLSAWLILTSPWIALMRSVPADAGFFDYAHVLAGCAAAVSVAAYAFACLRAGGWRSYFPWLEGQIAALQRDARGLLQGRVPPAEAGGLFAVIEGLLLASLLITAATGVAWLLLQGDAAAVVMRGWHIVAARSLMGLMAAHIVSVSLHFVALAGD
jgi:hypothetical protein